jgi:glucose-6-phosphate dehydrogenase assembly protein OpcA
MCQALTHAVAGNPALGISAPAHPVVEVRYRRDDRALAWLLAGWLSARLGWTDVSDMPVTVTEHDEGEEALAVSIGGGAITAVMNGERVLVEFRDDTPPFSIGVPRENEADAVAAELRNLTYDRGLRDALTALAARLTSSESF